MTSFFADRAATASVRKANEEGRKGASNEGPSSAAVGASMLIQRSDGSEIGEKKLLDVQDKNSGSPFPNLKVMACDKGRAFLEKKKADADLLKQLPNFQFGGGSGAGFQVHCEIGGKSEVILTAGGGGGGSFRVTGRTANFLYKFLLQRRIIFS